MTSGAGYFAPETESPPCIIALRSTPVAKAQWEEIIPDGFLYALIKDRDVKKTADHQKDNTV